MTQATSPRLLIVDSHGNIVHRLLWEAGQYVVEAEVIEAVPTSDRAPSLQPAEPGAAQTSQEMLPVTPQQDTAAAASQPVRRAVYTADAILAELKRAYEPLQDAVIVAADGTVLAATSDMAGTMMGEVVTALIEFGMQACQTLDMGDMLEISSRDTQTLSLTYPAAHGVALAVTTASHGNLGLLYRSCQSAVQHLAEQP